MIYIRSLLYSIGQILSAALVFLTALACYPFVSRRTLDKVIVQWAVFNIWSLDKICGTKHRIEGLENLPDEPSIVIANHQSAWETLAFQLIFPAQSYLLKRELLWIPIFGWGLAMNRPIAIDRSKKSRALDTLIKEGTARLEEGRWLVIFPEGSRMPPGEPGTFQAGGAMLAVRTGRAVIPVAHNAGVCWPKRGFLKQPGVIDVCIGSPIDAAGLKTRELNAAVETWITERLETLPGISSK